MKTLLFCLFALNTAFAQIEKDDAHQVTIEYNSFKGSVAGECNDAEIKMPAVFELHGEQTLNVEVTNIKEWRLMIFDRKGTKLFESEISVLYNAQTDIKDGKKKRNVDTGWSGRFQSQLLPSEMYVYTINAVCVDEKKFKGNGFIQFKHE